MVRVTGCVSPSVTMVRPLVVVARGRGHDLGLEVGADVAFGDVEGGGLTGVEVGAVEGDGAGEGQRRHGAEVSDGHQHGGEGAGVGAVGGVRHAGGG